METPLPPCANHPAPATFTCARCGSFACEACRSPQAAGTWCVSCGARYATPGLPVGEVLSDTFGFLVRYPAPIAVFAGFGTGMALLLVLLVCCYLRLTGRWLPPSVAR
ncbi:hypothetical protein ACN28S_27095 [Cystobacter fuscus]